MSPRRWESWHCLDELQLLAYWTGEPIELFLISLDINVFVRTMIIVFSATRKREKEKLSREG
jgi:hypothetical protein